jgi:hypothetical protein
MKKFFFFFFNSYMTLEYLLIIDFPKFDPLTAAGMALCVNLGLKCQNLFPLVSVLRIRDVYPGSQIRDVYPGSRILIFTHPGSRISDPGSKNSNKRER